MSRGPWSFIVVLVLAMVLCTGGKVFATKVHDFTCGNCHVPLSGQHAGLKVETVCLLCHSAGNDVPIQRLSNPLETTNPPGGLFEPGDASNLLGSYPGGSIPDAETSHMWDAAEVNPAAGANTPQHYRFYVYPGTVSFGKVTCSRCHDVHGQQETNPQLLKLGEGQADAMCLDCHRDWNQPNNRGLGTHPIVADYAAVAAAKPTKFRSAPDNSGTEANITLVDGNSVSCTSCHGIHWTDSDSTTTDGKTNVTTLHAGDGRILKHDGPERENPDYSLCQACHRYKRHGGNSPTIGCLVCHGSHEYDPGGNPNYFMLKKQVTLNRPLLDETQPDEEITVSLDYTTAPAPGNYDGYSGICLQCHVDNLSAAHDAGRATCSDCHIHESGFAHGVGSSGIGCVECHGHETGTLYDPDSSYPYTAGTEASQGRGTTQSHSTHTEQDGDDLRGPGIYCNSCHDINNFPYFVSGVDGDGDGRYDLTETDVCNPCHSSGGGYNGISSTGGSIGAKDNWKTGVYNADDSIQAGKEKWCIGCHDADPAIISGESAPNKAGDNSSYGYYVNGHGRDTSYDRLSWQDTAAIGNPGADQTCTNCHDSASGHISTTITNTRLLAGFNNDQLNTNCSNCHASGGSATSEPLWYTVSAEYEDSAHGGTLCTECHEVHGAAGPNPAMTRGEHENLCYQCHTEGQVMNDSLSDNRPGGYSSADDIEQAFGKSEIHNLGTSFSNGGKNYTLECISCHNVHVITGKYWEAEQNKSPVTRFPGNSDGIAPTEVWGDDAGEKMDDFAGKASGTGGFYRKIAEGYQLGATGMPANQPAKYQPPKAGGGYDAEYSGDIVPDYTSLCLDCHSERVSAASPAVNWGQGIGCTDNSVDPPDQRIECGAQHGLGTAGKPSYVSDSGTAGFWGNSGNPDALFQMNYVTRGRHNGHFMRWPYDSAERGGGINFVLSCTDCHEAHGSNRGSMIRERFNVNANGDCGTGGNSDPDGENCNDGGLWNNFCNACHYYYDGQHADKSCGTASCHEANSIHRIIHTVDSGGANQLMLTSSGYESDFQRPTFTPEIEMVASHVGSNELSVTFRESEHGGTPGLYSNADLSGALDKDDFWLFDKGSNNPRTITGVTHAAGDLTATLTMSAPVVAADLSTDTLAMKPASAWAWYVGGYNNAATGAMSAQAVSAGPWPATVTGPPPFNIQGSLYGRSELKLNGIIEDSNQIYVTFAEGAYANIDATGVLQPSDFDLNCGGRSITTVTHTAGDTFAILTLDSIISQSEIGSCTVAAASGAIYDLYGNPAGTGTIATALPPEASANDLVLRWNFNEVSGDVLNTGALGTQEDMHGMLTRNVVRAASTIPGKAAAGDNVVKMDRDDNAASDSGAVQLNYEIDSGDGFPAKFTNVEEAQYTGEFTFSVWIKPTDLGCQEGQDRGLNVKLRRDVVTTQFWVKNWALGIMRFSPDGNPIAGNCSDDPDDTGPLLPYDADSTHDVLRFWVSVGDPADQRCDPWGGTMPEAVLPVSPAGYYQGGWITGTCGNTAYTMPTNKWTHAFAQTETVASGAPTYGGVALQAGVWQHVVGTWDGRYIRIYIDGQLAAETDMGGTGNYAMLADPLLWGGDLVGDGSVVRHVSSFFAAGARPTWSSSGAPSAGAEYWNTNGFYNLNNSTYVGELDDVKYWKKALPVTTIQD